MKALKYIFSISLVLILMSCGEASYDEYSYQEPTTYTDSEYYDLQSEYEEIVKYSECLEELIDEARYGIDNIYIDYYDPYVIDMAINDMSDISYGLDYWRC